MPVKPTDAATAVAMGDSAGRLRPLRYLNRAADGRRRNAWVDPDRGVLATEVSSRARRLALRAATDVEGLLSASGSRIDQDQRRGPNDSAPGLITPMEAQKSGGGLSTATEPIALMTSPRAK